jgi:LCP family protein required for cell wall assembly
MSDKQNPNDPQYDWLYAADRDAGSPDPPAEPPLDDEATRAIPRPGESTDEAEPGVGHSTDEPEHTQVLDVGEPPRLAPAAASAAAATYQPPAEPEPEAVSSFGGTYPAPGPSSPSAYAPPVNARDPAAGARFATPSTDQGGPPGSGGPPTSTGDGGRRPSKGKRRTRNWWARGIVALLVVWVLFLVAVPLWAWHNITKVDAEPSGSRPPDTPGTTYLLVGSDSRSDLTKQQRGQLGTGNAAGQRTDTIILLHVPAGDGPRLLLSIPRDSYVDIPGHGMNKINAAFSIGGPKLLVQTVEKATDVRVDDYIEVGFEGFVDVVDAVGGITICPETAIDDPKAGNLKLKKGCQEVDGTTALGYSRSRAFPLGDITRTEHQREVIAAVGHEAASWKTVLFPWRYVRVNKAAADSLTIGDNVGPIALARFAWAMSHTSGDSAKRCVVPYSSLGTSTSIGSVVTWDDSAADAIFKEIRDDDTASIKCSATGQ